MATYAPAGKLPEVVEALEKAKKASRKAEIIALINDGDLPREVIPTQWLNELEVWDALLPRMPLTALVRKLGKVVAERFFPHRRLFARWQAGELPLAPGVC